MKPLPEFINMQSKIRAYFQLNRQDLRGLSVLFVVSISLLLTPSFYRFYFPPAPLSNAKFEKLFAEYLECLPVDEEQAWTRKTNSYSTGNRSQAEYASEDYSAAWKPGEKIDPNNTNFKQLIALGISKKTAGRWVNYNKAGGRFFKAKDLEKIYGISAEELQLLEEGSLVFSNKKSNKKKFNKSDSFPSEKKKFKNKYDDTSKTIKKDSLFAFDPNEVSPEDLAALPISVKAQKSLLAYRGAGGKFKIKSDLKKLYGLEDQDFHQIESYINLPNKTERNFSEQPNFNKQKSQGGFADQPKAESFEEPEAPKILLDINTASVNDWMEIRGVGKYYARAITKYRTALGGFHSLDQLLEVPGMRKESYLKINQYLKIESKNLRTIDVNSAEKEILVQHPYIESKVASSIVKYRRKHGSYKKLSDLKKSYLIDGKLLTKISPYLSIGSSNENHDSSENKGTPKLFKGSRTGP